MTSARFDVTGMSCAHCKAAVEGELSKVSGVERSIAVPETGVVEVVYDQGQVDTGRLVEAIEAAGYSVSS